MLKHRCLILPCIFLPSIVLGAETDNNLSFEDLFAMSLQDLSKVRVSTVSKRDESFLESPGITTVITAAEIKAFGATNVKDVLLRIPNFYMFDSSTFTASGVTMRAGATQHLNNHVLYLINGRPLRESQNGGWHTDINLLLPVNSLERIEVVRGPGSVLYGTNAFSGTINFITKSEQTAYRTNDVRLKLMGGVDDHVRVGGSFQTSFNDRGGISLHISDLDRDGETISAVDEVGVKDSLMLSRKGKSLLLNASYDGLTFNSMMNEIATPFVSGAFRWSNMAEIELQREFYDVGYRHDFKNDWALSINYTYNQLDRYITGPGTNSSEFKTNGDLYEVALRGELTDHSSLSIGAVVDRLQGDLGGRGGDYENTRHSFYSQWDFQASADTKLLLGAQWNKPEDGESHISPRIALTKFWNEKWSSKMLYSDAYRSPYGAELYFQSPFLNGDTNLKPETIRTLEGHLAYSTADYYLTATYYHSETEDAIGRAIVDGTNTFVNEDTSITFNGIEVDGKWSISEALKLQGSYHYQINEDENGQGDFMPAARTMTKMGLAYKYSNAYQFGLWVSYFGKASKLENLEGNSTQVVNPDADDFTLLSLNMQTNLGKMFNSRQLNKVDFSLYANNILGEEVYYPELGRRLVNTYPQSHERGVYAEFTIKF